MALFEALYGRPCNSPSCWLETREKCMLGTDMIRETSDKIKVNRQRMKAAQDRQKSYADNRRKDLEFKVRDMVFLMVTPRKGVIWFGKQGKLSPRYIGPYYIIERIGLLSYAQIHRSPKKKSSASMANAGKSRSFSRPASLC